MIKFDFTSMCNFNKELLDKKAEVLCKFNNSYICNVSSCKDNA